MKILHLADLHIGKIVLDEEINKKFLDFDNNRDTFYSGNKEDYFCKIYDYVRKIVYKSRNAGEMILNKFFVSNIIRILKKHDYGLNISYLHV